MKLVGSNISVYESVRGQYRREFYTQTGQCAYQFPEEFDVYCFNRVQELTEYVVSVRAHLISARTCPECFMPVVDTCGACGWDIQDEDNWVESNSYTQWLKSV